jgi:hypothetical protein
MIDTRRLGLAVASAAATGATLGLAAAPAEAFTGPYLYCRADEHYNVHCDNYGYYVGKLSHNNAYTYVSSGRVCVTIKLGSNVHAAHCGGSGGSAKSNATKVYNVTPYAWHCKCGSSAQGKAISMSASEGVYKELSFK